MAIQHPSSFPNGSARATTNPHHYWTQHKGSIWCTTLLKMTTLGTKVELDNGLSRLMLDTFLISHSHLKGKKTPGPSWGKTMRDSQSNQPIPLLLKPQQTSIPKTTGKCYGTHLSTTVSNFWAGRFLKIPFQPGRN